MRKCVSLLLLLFISVSVLQSQTIKHVLLIGLDGVSSEGFQYALTPVMDDLISKGCLSLKTRAVLPTVSAPNWATILSGAGPEQHGVTSNEWSMNNQPYEPTIKDDAGYFTSIFTVIKKQQPKAITGMFYDWDWIGSFINPVYLNENKFITGYQKVTSAARDFIKQQKPLFTFVYYGHPDEVGHQIGHGTPEYFQSINDVDTEIGKLITTLKETGLYASTCILVVSDHGGIGKGHGGESKIELEVPWIISGPGIAKNKILNGPNDQANTAPTITKTLALKTPVEWIGRPNKDAFALATDPKSKTSAWVRKPFCSLKEGVYSSPQPVELKSLSPESIIYYSLDGSTPGKNSKKYTGSFTLSEDVTLNAVAVNGNNSSQVITLKFSFTEGIHSASLKTLPSSKYPGNGVNSLFDGLIGSANYKGKQWMGWEGDDFEVDIDLGEIRKIESIGLDVLQLPASWIFLPSRIEFYSSEDGIQFIEQGAYNPADVDDLRKDGPVLLARTFESLNTRYLRVKAYNTGTCPAGHPGEGQKAWLFISEVEIE
ncbi:MAG: alkaline phosphatase family protein [Bacteroidales bacterium]|nr:alkaline phosphatase family protein [Bacteroidales bacterium]